MAAASEGQGSSATLQIAEGAISHQGQAAQILVVDDEESTRTLVARCLSRLRYDVVAVDSAAAALAQLDIHNVDLALLDIEMPNMSGLELLVQLKQKSPESEVIMLTGNGSLEIALESVRKGACDFIPKPFHVEQIQASVARALERRRLNDATALYRASHAIFATREIQKLPAVIVEVSVRVMSADSVSLLLPGVDGQLYIAHAYGLDPSVQKHTRIAPNQGIAGRVATNMTPIIIQGDVRAPAGRDAPASREEANRNRAKSSIVYPLVSDGRLIGMLTFNRFTEDRPFRQHELEKAGVLASQVLLALETTRLARQSLMTEKLAAVGQLASGIAHEINTPIQFIGDSVNFLATSIGEMSTMMAKYKALHRAVADGAPTAPILAEIEALENELDVAYSLEQMPAAVTRTLEGVRRVTEIVRAMKAFGRSDQKDKTLADVNQLISNTLTIARAEYKYVADVVTEFGEVPPIPCLPGEVGQVFLILIVNAAQAMAETELVKQGGKGTLTVQTALANQQVVVSFGDTGNGIPFDVRERIFDPFFTTKEVGKGTGLGLPIARTIVVDKHGGSLSFASELGKGTTFFVRLPIEVAR